jgi:serine protease Do
MGVLKTIRGTLILASALAVGMTLGAQTATTPPPAAAPPAQETPPQPPKPPRPPRASTRTMVHVGGGSFLGVDIMDVTPDRVSALKLPDESGVEITAVDQDSPAGKAGLKEHDVIRTFNGQKVDSAEALRRMIHETPAGRTIELGVFRDGKNVTVKPTLADRYRNMNIMVPRIEVPMPQINIDTVPLMDGYMLSRNVRNGMSLESLTPQLREFFGVPADQGLLVRSVERGSSAETSGLKAGDVIVKVGNQPVHNLADFHLGLRNPQNGTVSITVVRDKREQNLTLKVPETKKTGDTWMSLEFPDYAEMQWDSAELARSAHVLAEQQKAWAKQWKDQQKDWQKQLNEQMKQLREQLQKMEEE